MTNIEIVKFLSSKTTNASFVDKLKIRYRPLICPFIDLINFSKDKQSVFDIGCGSGQFCSLIANYTNVKKIMGIEISQKLVDNAKEVNANVKSADIYFEYFDGINLPSRISEYQIVYMIDVFHHIPPSQQFQFLQELYKKMEVNSILVFKDINAANPFVLFNKLHDIIFSGEVGKEISHKKAIGLLHKVGFKIKSNYKKTTFVYPHYFVICEK